MRTSSWKITIFCSIVRRKKIFLRINVRAQLCIKSPIPNRKKNFYFTVNFHDHDLDLDFLLGHEYLFPFDHFFPGPSFLFDLRDRCNLNQIIQSYYENILFDRFYQKYNVTFIEYFDNLPFYICAITPMMTASRLILPILFM